MNDRTVSPNGVVMLGSLILAVLSVGCTAFAISMDKSHWRNVVQKPIGVIVLIPEKRLVLSELLFRVVWAERRETYYSFDGIWDPAPILEQNCVATLQRDFNIRTLTLRGAVEPGSYRDLVAVAEAAFNTERRQVKAPADRAALREEFWTKPPMKYLRARPTRDLGKIGERLGVDFILELSLAGISMEPVGPFGIQGGTLSVFVYGRLIRVADEAVVWLNRAAAGVHEKELTDLQEDLELLREDFDEAVMRVCEPDGIFRGLKPH